MLASFATENLTIYCDTFGIGFLCSAVSVIWASAIVVHYTIDMFRVFILFFIFLVHECISTLSLSLCLSHSLSHSHTVWFSLSLSVTHSHTHSFPSIHFLFPCWQRWQLKPLPNWLAVKHHFAPVIQMSSPDSVYVSPSQIITSGSQLFHFNFTICVRFSEHTK